jgi:hypothetical protein
MSLPPAAAPRQRRAEQPSGTASTAVDPFGLWQPPGPAELAGDGVSFGDLSELPEEEQPAAVWQLALSSGAAGRISADQELQRRAEQIEAIQKGLADAGPRVEKLLAQRASPLSFGLDESELPAPELALASLLDTWEGGPAESSEASFGMGEDLARMVGVDWEAMRRSLEGLLDSVNRQILHFVWVETMLDGHLAARSMVNWGGDLRTLWQDGLWPEHIEAHRRSLELALASRQANLRTILTVSQIAGKIALAVATPLGPLQALSLGWQFVHDIIIPLMKPTN